MTPQIHNQLRAGFLSGALTRAVGDMRGEGGIERYGETLTPTIDLWSRPEWNYLRKDYLVSRFLTSAAVAGEYSMIALVNPAGSNGIAVVERIAAWGGAVGTALYVSRATAAIWTATLAGVGGRGVSRDSRILYNINPGFCDFWTGSDAAMLGTAIGVCPISLANAATDCLGLPYVLTPGEGLAVLSNTVNTVVYATFMFRERMAQRGELE